MTFSYNEERMLSEIVWMAIANGNTASPKAFEPTPEQYKMLCQIANRLDDHIETMKKDYSLG